MKIWLDLPLFVWLDLSLLILKLSQIINALKQKDNENQQPRAQVNQAVETII